MLKSSARAGLALAAIAAVSFAGCSSSGSSPSTAGGSASPVPSSSAAPTITIAYEENGQVELTLASGARIFVDVWNSSALSAKPTASDVLLLTHREREEARFEESFPGKKLLATTGQLDAAGASITSIDGSHTDDPVVPGNASNHIVVIEVDGFRIVACGEDGEEALSTAQLAAIGTADIAICPVINVGGMDATGHKAVN